MAGDRISAIQGYRFLLFFAVFLFHCVSSWFSVGWGGRSGVSGPFVVFLDKKNILI